MYQVEIIHENSLKERPYVGMQKKINNILATDLKDVNIVNISLSNISGMTDSKLVAIILYEAK